MKFEVREEGKPEIVYGFFWCEDETLAHLIAHRWFTKEIFRQGIEVVKVSNQQRKAPSDYQPHRDFYDKGLF